MSYYKKHCTRTAVAMWTIFATVLTLASAGTMLLIAFAAVATVGLAAAGLWFLLRLSPGDESAVTASIPATVARRQA